MVVDAITRSRDALVGSYNAANNFSPPMPPIDDTNQLKKWTTDVRLHVCQYELFAPLRFNLQGVDKAGLAHFDELAPIGLQVKNIVDMTRPSTALFQKQVDLVINWANLREDRAVEVLAQANNSSPFWGSIVNLQPQRHKYTSELLMLAQSFAVHAEMRLKHAFACPRPAQYSAQIQPMLTTPGHGSWPSGHSTEAFMTARVLQNLMNVTQLSEIDLQLQRLAARIAINRTVAGVHFPVDSAAGRLLGEALAGYFVYRCQAQPSYKDRSFDGTLFKDGSNALDFDYHAALQTTASTPFNAEGASRTLTTQSDILKTLWDLAKDEWL
jgi:hypothetical protein